MQRDFWFHGIHSPPSDSPIDDLDIYGTFREKFVVLPKEQVLIYLRCKFKIVL